MMEGKRIGNEILGDVFACFSSYSLWRGIYADSSDIVYGHFKCLFIFIKNIYNFLILCIERNKYPHIQFTP